MSPQRHHMTTLVSLLLIVLLAVLINNAEGFLFWKATTTACDTCDGIDTYSGRNVACCLLQSKCCGYNSIDEAELIRANETNSTPSP